MRVKKKVMYFLFEVPEYYDDKDLFGVPIYKDGKVDDTTDSVESMLTETLIFCEKKFNKRIDDEGSLNGTIVKPEDIKETVDYAEKCKSKNPFEQSPLQYDPRSKEGK